MFDLATFTSFLGWCSVINIGVLGFTTLMLWLIGDWAKGIQSKMFGIDTQSLSSLYVTWLGNYKLMIIIFNIVPYAALKMMS